MVVKRQVMFINDTSKYQIRGPGRAERNENEGGLPFLVKVGTILIVQRCGSKP